MSTDEHRLTLTPYVPAKARRKTRNSEANKLSEEDRPIHGWYRFVLSFPPHLVRAFLEKFGISAGQTVLDPFCGTGTTLVECKKLGISSVGVEANPFPAFASEVKTDWSVEPNALLEHAQRIAELTKRRMASVGLTDENGFGLTGLGKPTRNRSVRLLKLPEEAEKLLLTGSISPIPLHKTLTLLRTMRKHSDPRFHRCELLALAKALVSSIGNLHFGPEVGVGRLKEDCPVVRPWLANVATMVNDITKLRHRNRVRTRIFCTDSRVSFGDLKRASVDAVITSPPYPNEKDYTRTTRLESVLLEFIRTKGDLRAFKENLLRSNTRNVYKHDDDDQWVAGHPEILELADQIEDRRIAMGKTSGFERLYARVTKLYFGGMARHLESLKTYLQPGAKLAYVVGDQASYLRVMIRTGRTLAAIARKLGYKIIGIELFRTRMATATRAQLREEVLCMEWPG
ncbi:MAG TPA: DNA methyltransferase [Phycisphaerae bacterium]|nr:DNA methyltransferase [Phycisphaerae bacterium]